ncbi:MAG: flippase [Clostridia bacterium]|nr:flippase [Clostridia bacterium]
MPKKSITKNYLYNLTYQILIIILPLITTPYLSRVLGAEGIGIYSYTYTIVTYFVLFGSLGVALYGQREIAYAQDNKEKRKKVFLELVIFRFITIAVATVIYYYFFIKTGTYSVYYKILLFELIAGAFDISWFFQGLEEFKKTVTRNILVRIISVSLIFIIVKTQADLIKYMYIYSIADFLGNLSLWIYLPKYLKGVKVKNINIIRQVPAIILLFIPQITNKLYNMLDTTMLGALIADKTETGFYEQSQKVIRLLLTIVTSLGVVMVPRMANMFANGEKEKINYYMKKSFSFVFLLSFPMIFGIISISKAFVPIFFGTGYDKAATLISIISPIILLMGIANVIGTQYLLPTKRQKEYTISVGVGVLANFILNYILIKLYSSIGACIATVLSQLIVDWMQFKYIKDEIAIKDVIKLSYKYLLASIMMFIACSLTKLIVSTGVISIVTQMVVGIAVYGMVLIILKDEYLYMFLSKLREKVLSKLSR